MGDSADGAFTLMSKVPEDFGAMPEKTGRKS
jgi:hypothetical protein